MPLSASTHAKAHAVMVFRIHVVFSLLHIDLLSARPVGPRLWCVQSVNLETEHDALDYSHKCKF
jgi:hypothetical protein